MSATAQTSGARALGSRGRASTGEPRALPADRCAASPVLHAARSGGTKSGAGAERLSHPATADRPATSPVEATPDPTAGPREIPYSYPHARGPEHPAWDGLLDAIAFGRELLLEAHAEGLA